MHSFMYRTNALLTFAGTVLAGICVLTSMTDMLHEADPPVHIELSRIDYLAPNQERENDEAWLGLFLDADLRSVFTWNTKQIFAFVQAEYVTQLNKVNQVVLWDEIIRKPKNAAISKKKIRQEYLFDDEGRNLRARSFNLTLVWNVMPKVGRLYTGSKTVPGFKFPEEYVTRR